MDDSDPKALCPHPADTAPTDGRAIRGYFVSADGRRAELIAVSWDIEWGWRDLVGQPMALRAAELKLAAWGPD